MTGDAGLRIGILGAVHASRAGVTLRLRGRRSGLLLAVLAMSARLPVHADRLADLLWPEEQPEHVLSSLYTLMARLRVTVGPGAIVKAADGYLLDVDPDAVDLLRFRRLVRAAREADGTGTALRLLDEALGLWRGEPLEGLQSAGLVPGLINERLAAAQLRADIELDTGLHDRVISELFGLTRQYPLREPLWERLITALAGAGRSAEAIQQYHEARQILADKLGVDPSAELQGIFQQLLQPGARTAHNSDHPRAEPQRHVPRQLPPRVSGFTGRAEHLRMLSDLADEAVAIAAVGGMAGAGKTALAVHWAHQVADRFPDGQLYADLGGFAAREPATPTDVLRVFLEELGEPPGRIPDSIEAREARYRTLLAGRRVLVILDNASDAAQVRPLLPAAPGCMTVITSRRALVPLAAEYGARLLSLDVLSESEAVELLSARLDTAQASQDAQAAGDVVAGCGRIPLALAIIAARAAARPALPLAAYAAELRDPGRRLDALETGVPPIGIRAAFSWSCLQLSDPARDLYRLLGVHPGPDISVHAAASLAGTAAAAAAALDELATLHLLTEHSPGRYLLHDLVRAHAAEQAAENMRPAERRAAIVHSASRRCDHQPAPSPVSAISARGGDRPGDLLRVQRVVRR